jgi:hypothetical protein
MAKIRKWNGDSIGKAVVQNVAAALGEFGLRVETHSKKELEHGHGVETGTLRRSIHTAQGGYNWSADNVEPSPASPERGNQQNEAAIKGSKITIQVGSGLSYALPVHQGHHSFDGYHYLTNGLEKAKPELPAVLKKHRLK